MRKTGASMMILALVIVVLIAFAATADAQLRPGANVPPNAGFAAQGKFPQGVQTGAMGQGQAGGFAGGAATVPGRVGQQQGAGITVGDLPGPDQNLPTGPIQGGQGGPGTCACIAAPCNCPGTGGGLPQGLPNANQPGTYTGPMVIGGQQTTGGIPFNPNLNTGQPGALQTAGAGQLIRR
jgi:hypothetical protein